MHPFSDSLQTSYKFLNVPTWERTKNGVDNRKEALCSGTSWNAVVLNCSCTGQSGQVEQT